MYIMRCVMWANGRQCQWAGQYLKWYDPNLPKDQDLAEWTDKIDEAKKYATFEELVQDWKRVRTVDGGLRPDGKPDRPLTAFTIEPVDLDKKQ